MTRRKKSLPAVTVTARIESLTHEGRGIARVDGKTVFVDGALPGEVVEFAYSRCRREYDEAEVVRILEPSVHRVDPRCPHFGVCGGCRLQHLAAPEQIRVKQQVLLDDLARIGKVRPDEVLAPLTGPVWGYRRKARLGAKYVAKKGKVLVGFRERASAFLADLSRCEVLHPSVGERLAELSRLIEGLSCRDQIPQIEVAVGDAATALVFRNLVALSAADTQALAAFGQAHDVQIYLQPGGPDSVTLLWPREAGLSYCLPEHAVEIVFEPTDFVQVNAELNRAMVDHALALLDPQPGDRVLDLFCGLGNFSLPIVRRVNEVVGVEGDGALVRRAQANAQHNGVDNVHFHAANLAEDVSGAPWHRKQRYDKVLLDPPRTGAAELLAGLPRLGVDRIVYVSCNPATLARDAGELVHRHGYRLARVGVMDMFPHTAHVESIALFVRD